MLGVRDDGRVRIDIVTIFPEFFSVLDVSLLGKARQSGLLELGVYDLRDFTHDRHRTVDDTPYGGGAGMVMKPEPWGEAFDSILNPATVVVFPSPAGERFTQATARELSGASHVVFACGRYEGIDQRVVEDAASQSRRLRAERRRGGGDGDDRGNRSPGTRGGRQSREPH
jgi:tRNA (guanine37-N1)-methyltransferase